MSRRPRLGSLLSRLLCSFFHSFLHSFTLETYIAPLQETTAQRCSQTNFLAFPCPNKLVSLPKLHSSNSLFLPCFLYFDIHSLLRPVTCATLSMLAFITLPYVILLSASQSCPTHPHCIWHCRPYQISLSIPID